MFYSGVNCEKGGWVFGGFYSEVVWCCYMCNMVNIIIIDVDYRMGFEYKFFVVIYDCWDVVKWVSLVLGLFFFGLGVEMIC